MIKTASSVSDCRCLPERLAERKLMFHGFIKVSAACARVHVANPTANVQELLPLLKDADEQKVNLLCLPELCISGYTCGDLFFSDSLLQGSLNALKTLRDATAGLYPVYIVGLPLRYCGKLYNCAAVLHDGRILGLVPKTSLPAYAEFYEMRQFSSGKDLGTRIHTVRIGQEEVPFGTHLLFAHETMENYCFGIEICEDAWSADTPATGLCLAGATVIANPSASNEVVGKQSYRRSLVNGASGRLLCGYVYACSDASESTQDLVFCRHHLISENGTLLAENPPFGADTCISSEIDVNRLALERHRMTSFAATPDSEYETVFFEQPMRETALTRRIDANPFVPPADDKLRERVDAILQIQTYGLLKRITHVNAKSIVLGISGGLDSTLALLVTVRAVNLLKRPRTDILAVTMPCFGTTVRTKSNAVRLCESLGVTLKEIDIKESVMLHMQDIGHDPEIRDVTYENSQARMRTQILMNLSNESGGFVVGTGDLSELALGWATYNGDHMSMYAVNCSVPKTLVRYIIRFEANRLYDEYLQQGKTKEEAEEIRDILLDIFHTPVSPELLPADEGGNIAQKTEDLVGPYELHDFFLYYHLRCGFAPDKIYRLACYAFGNAYPPEVIRKWLKVFLRRFFTQQFKRSCLPDGPKVGSATLSPRGDWRMPSDAEYGEWLNALEAIE